MTIEQLKYFLAIVEYQTFSQAALEMNISQSSLSKQIAKLEQVLGIELFDRNRRQIKLTPEGEAIVENVKEILGHYGLMMANISSMAATCAPVLKIAMLPVYHQLDIATRLRNFAQVFPETTLIVDEIEEKDLDASFPFGDYDIFILRDVLEQLGAYSRFKLFDDHLVVALNKSHPLAGADTLSLARLKDESFYLLPKYTAITKKVLEACQGAGYSPKVNRYGRLETILAAVNSNQGIALVMEQSLNMFNLENIMIIPLNQYISRNVYLYCKPNLKNTPQIRYLSQATGK